MSSYWSVDEPVLMNACALMEWLKFNYCRFDISPPREILFPCRVPQGLGRLYTSWGDLNVRGVFDFLFEYFYKYFSSFIFISIDFMNIFDKKFIIRILSY